MLQYFGLAFRFVKFSISSTGFNWLPFNQL